VGAWVYIASGTLQWGRDQLIAEMSLRSMRCKLQHQLQWGRDQLIAEMRSKPSPGTAACGFNGAAIS